jgi:hypothetical protein
LNIKSLTISHKKKKSELCRIDFYRGRKIIIIFLVLFRALISTISRVSLGRSVGLPKRPRSGEEEGLYSTSKVPSLPGAQSPEAFLLLVFEKHLTLKIEVPFNQYH